LHAPAPDRRTIEPPDWLPVAVRSHVLLIHKLFADMPAEFHATMPEFATLHRLATDSRMKRVWKELLRHKPQDNALVEFFDCAFHRARFPHLVTTPRDRAAQAKPWAEAAELCRWTREHDITARMDPGLIAALDVVAQHFGKGARREGNLDSPLVVKHHYGDDVARAYVRVLSQVTRELFGTTLFRTVATTASVALGRKIDGRQVRNWTKS
jgi:hypothetical protein